MSKGKKSGQKELLGQCKRKSLQGKILSSIYHKPRLCLSLCLDRLTSRNLSLILKLNLECKSLCTRFPSLLMLEWKHGLLNRVM